MEDDVDKKPDDERFAYRRDWSDEARDAECQRCYGADGQSFDQEFGVHLSIIKRCQRWNGHEVFGVNSKGPKWSNTLRHTPKTGYLMNTKRGAKWVNAEFPCACQFTLLGACPRRLRSPRPRPIALVSRGMVSRL
jgi:hypothetical protein